MTKHAPCEGRKAQAETHAAGHLGRLVQLLLANWPRRGHTLLEVGCGDGVFLDMLWTLGFDVTGLDSHADLLASARSRVGVRCELQHGVIDSLPWDDDAFDYVTLLSVFMQPHNAGVAEGVEAVVREAVRVARRGVVLVFPNCWSLAWAMTRLRRKPGADCTAYSPWNMLRIARAVCPTGTEVRVRSILPGPPMTWAGGRLWNRLNRWVLPVPLGAYAGLCLDMSPPIPLTGLPLLVKASCMMPEASSASSTAAASHSPIASHAATLHAAEPPAQPVLPVTAHADTAPPEVSGASSQGVR